MFKLRNKTIIILSPQAWGKMHISKHHYAIELTKRDNIVYFFNPPDTNHHTGKVKIEKEKNNNNLYIVNYSFIFPYNIKFHIRKLFDLLLKPHLNYILKKINRNIDVVWNFDTNLFSDLNIFGNNITKIYHPVDNITGKHQKSLIDSSDYIFTVSEVIKNDLQKANNSKEIHLINHGVSDYFLSSSKKSSPKNNKKKIKTCFLGNLLVASLDRKITKRIISENTEVEFIFIGAYYSGNLGGTTDVESKDFISFLKNSDNVILKGAMHPKDAVKELQKADILMVLIDPMKDINKGSNSHKIIEYLSTGKVIVSNHISSYKDKPGLIEMVDEMTNEKLPELFIKVKNNLNYYNNTEMQQKRIDYANDNTYEKQISRIENIIKNTDKIR